MLMLRIAEFTAVKKRFVLLNNISAFYTTAFFVLYVVF